MERNCIGKDPWEKLGGKACPSRLSKYPASSHWGACARSLNSLKVPFICSKSRFIFIQGLLFLDKSLALVQAPDCVRMFHRPQQESTAKWGFPAGPLSCDTDSKSQPRALRSAAQLGSDWKQILVSTPILLETLPTPTWDGPRLIVLSWGTLFSASYHIVDSPCGASWQNIFSLPKHLLCIWFKSLTWKWGEQANKTPEGEPPSLLANQTSLRRLAVWDWTDIFPYLSPHFISYWQK